MLNLNTLQFGINCADSKLIFLIFGRPLLSKVEGVVRLFLIKKVLGFEACSVNFLSSSRSSMRILVIMNSVCFRQKLGDLELFISL